MYMISDTMRLYVMKTNLQVRRLRNGCALDSPVSYTNKKKKEDILVWVIVQSNYEWKKLHSFLFPFPFRNIKRRMDYFRVVFNGVK